MTRQSNAKRAQKFSPTRSKATSASPEERKEPAKIGIRLKHARLVKRLRLKELADEVGCSESMISKIENDKTMPSVAMLHRLAVALDTNIGVLFDLQATNGCVTRSGERPVLTSKGHSRGAGVSLEWLSAVPTSTLYQASIHIVEPGKGSDGAIVHDGEEFGYVLEGNFELTVGDEEYLLAPGDSFCFASQRPHAYRNPGIAVTRVLWFNTPPTF
jgi:mannose-6-phosphate isomerase-like protein (cupin superfamily)/DNA-binding Xre family transcriptional regulator